MIVFDKTIVHLNVSHIIGIELADRTSQRISN